MNRVAAFLERWAGVIPYDGTEEHWFTCPELGETIGITAREVQHAIQDARNEGAPIISGDKGYKWSTDREEVEDYIERHHSRSVSLLTTISGMKRGLDTHFPPDDDGVHQMELEEVLAAQ